MNIRLLGTTVLLCISFLFAETLLVAAALPDAVGYVNDFAGVMDERTRGQVQLIAEALRREQGVELAVVTVDETSPMTPKEYAVELFRQWGIGGPEDSGLLILLSLGERRIEVEVGYGLEGSLPDGQVGAIIDRAMMPHFRENNWGGGLSDGAQAFRQVLAGESFAASSASGGDSRDWIRTFLIFLVIAVFITLQSRRRPPGGFGGSSRRPSRMGGGHWGGRPPTLGGGRKSGGFGGFGGGRSGGGGAGRSF